MYRSIVPLILIGLALGDPSSLWPRPNEYTSGNSTVAVDSNFEFISKNTSPRLIRALRRYKKQLDSETWIPVVPTFRGKLSDASSALTVLDIQVESEDDTLDDLTDESYHLYVGSGNDGDPVAMLTAKTIYGAMWGLESFLQMVQYDQLQQQRFVAKTPFTIDDSPQFAHRGLLLDTSRNYYPVEALKRTLRAMSMNKMNVFHWHLIDSHSWPFQSKLYPQLSAKGAIYPDQIYSYSDIKALVRYGLDRGVRVIPEIEAPAHSYAMGLSFPEIATCMNTDEWDLNAAEPPSGQIDPTNPKSITVVNGLIDELSGLFPDKYVHLSGDEVNTNCWNSTLSITEYLKANNQTLDNLLPSFASKMHERAQKNGKSIMVWQEIVLNHNIKLPKDALVQVWLGASDAKKVISKGHRVIASSYQYWYLDCGKGAWLGDDPSGSSWCDPYKHWQMVYTYDLLANLTLPEQRMVVGGEVAIWSEQADDINLDNYAWPRTSAAAEVLWSGNRDESGNVMSTKNVLPRLNNFRFRLVSQGIRAEPLQPLWCVVNPGRCDTPSSMANRRKPYVPPSTS